MKLIRNLRIRTKLLLALLLLIVPLVYFVQDKIKYEANKRRELIDLSDYAYEADRILQVIHSVQKERGLSISYLSSKGANFGNRFDFQTKRTDVLLEKSSTLIRENSGITLYLSQLQEVRDKVMDRSISMAETEQYYRKLIDNIIKRFDRLIYQSDNSEMHQYLRAQYDLVRVKERLGRIRSLIVGAAPKKVLSKDERNLFTQKITAYEIYLEEFKTHAPAPLYDYFTKQLSSDSIRHALQSLYRLKTFDSLDSLQMGIDDWYWNLTKYIDQLRKVESAASATVISRSDKELSATTTGLIVYTTLTILVVGVGILLAFYVIRLIITNITHLRESAEKIAKGKTDVRLKVIGKDEISDLSRSFDLVIRNYQDIAESVELMGRGRYDVDINIRSDEDIIGKSLEKMRLSLRDLKQETTRRDWLQRGSLKLTDALSNTETGSFSELCDNLLTFVAEYLGAKAGAIYTLTETGTLKVMSTYGVDRDKVVHKEIKSGETLTGVVFKDDQYQVIRNLPDNFYHISTGLGDVAPKNGLLYPLSYQGEVLGVLEFAFLKEVDEDDLDFMKTTSEKIALALASARSRQQLEELLYRSQQQAEELEAQQEELRQVNEELTENSRMLQASEEELKVQQEELQEKNRELEEKARELSDQFLLVNRKNQEVEESRKLLEIKNKQLETTSQYKSEFLANMSHELRTPLNSILILTRLLSENKKGNLSEKQVEFAETIYRSGNDLLKLINEILDLAKVEAGKTTLSPENFSPDSLDLESTFVPIAKEKNIEFTVNYNPDLPETIYQDKDRLNQILKNLLSNAFKFTDSGGKVSLNVYSPSKTTGYRNPALNEADDVIAFQVKDSGIGIPTDKLDLIFEAFQQVDSSTSRKYGGTGLGLSISKELAILMGGEIEVLSVEEKGSDFTVYLPSHLPENNVRTRQDKIDVPDFKKETTKEPESVKVTEVPQEREQAINTSFKKVLVIEDDPDFGQALCRLAEDSGVSVKLIKNGKEAREFLSTHTPTAIILDLGLPGVSGKELLEYIQSNPRLNHVPHYIVSGTAKEDLELTTSVNFLKKPVSKEELYNLFEKLTECRKEDLRQILLVDDDPDHNKAVSELLCSSDLGCHTAKNAEEALEITDKVKFDAVILDLGLPGKDGYWLMEKLREKPGFGNIPIMVLSGKEIDEEDEVKIRKFSDIIICKNSAAFDRLKNEVGAFFNQLQPVRKPPQHAQILTQEHSLKGKKALVVDDDIRNIYALSNVLEEEGMYIVTAGNGQEALEKLEKSRDIDIVLMDIMMPVMDGYKAMQEIRKRPEISKLPVIALTAKAMPGDRARCIEAGASDYIPKPVNTEQLIPLMKVWLYP